MEKGYASKGTTLTFYPIPDDVLLSIGRLVRAWGELEQMINLYIQSLTLLNDSQILLFLGRQNISAKIALAGKLAKVKSKAADKLHQKLFVKESQAANFFNIALKCRNVVSHGRYVGVTKDGKYAFATTDIGAYDKTFAVTDVHCYDAENLGQIARFAEAVIDGFVHELKLGPLLEKQLPKTLGRHPKAPKRPSRTRTRRPSASGM